MSRCKIKNDTEEAQTHSSMVLEIPVLLSGLNAQLELVAIRYTATEVKSHAKTPLGVIWWRERPEHVTFTFLLFFFSVFLCFHRPSLSHTHSTPLIRPPALNLIELLSVVSWSLLDAAASAHSCIHPVDSNQQVAQLLFQNRRTPEANEISPCITSTYPPWRTKSQSIASRTSRPRACSRPTS